MADDIPYDDDLDVFRSLSVTTEKRTAREWAELEPEAKRGKFFLSSVEDERLLEAFRKLIDECMAEGVSEAEFINRATEMLRVLKDPAGTPYYNPAKFAEMTDAEKHAYQRTQSNIDSYVRLKLIFRTQSELAAGYREWRKAFEPFWLEMYPGWRFVRQPGAKPKWKRKLHVQHENEVHLKTDIKFWLSMNAPEIGGFNNPYGPWGFNSWMRVEQVSRKECERLGLLKKGEKIVIPPELARWGLPVAVAESNTASVKELPAEAVDRIKERNKERGTELEETERGELRPKPRRTRRKNTPAPAPQTEPETPQEGKQEGEDEPKTTEPKQADPEQEREKAKETTESEQNEPTAKKPRKRRPPSGHGALYDYVLRKLAAKNKPKRADYATRAEFDRALEEWEQKFFGTSKGQDNA